MIIDKEFFIKYQRPILWFSNTGIGRRFFNLGDQKIDRILPSSVRVLKAVNAIENTYEELFISRNVYAIKLGKILFWLPVIQLQRNGDIAFRPAYQLAAIFLIGLILKPAGILFAGLTSTFNPVTGSNSPIDGVVANSVVGQPFTHTSGTYASATDVDSSISGHRTIYQDASTQQCSRHVFHFDTSPLTSAATISSAIFSDYVSAKTIVSGSFTYWRLVANTLGSDSAIVTSDYNQATHWGTAALAPDLAAASVTAGVYNAWSITNPNTTTVNKTGLTRLGLRINYDITGTSPGNPTDITLTSVFADNGSNPPKLVVVYKVGNPVAAKYGASLS